MTALLRYLGPLRRSFALSLSDYLEESLRLEPLAVVLSVLLRSERLLDVSDISTGRSCPVRTRVATQTTISDRVTVLNENEISAALHKMGILWIAPLCILHSAVRCHHNQKHRSRRPQK